MNYITHRDIRIPVADLATALNNQNAAIFCKQLDDLLKKEAGTIVDGVKYIGKTYEEWKNTQFQQLSTWQLRQCVKLLRSLGIVKVVRYQAFLWKQTNFYTIDYKRMEEFLEDFFQNSK